MKKWLKSNRIFVYLLSLVLMFILVCCSEETTIEQKSKSEETSTTETSSHSYVSPNSMFVFIEEGSNWRVAYHRDTKVMYVISDGAYTTGVFTVLVNPDGTPMLYDENSD